MRTWRDRWSPVHITSTRRVSARLFFFFQAEDGIRDYKVTGFRRVLFRSRSHDAGRRRTLGGDHWLARVAAFVDGAAATGLDVIQPRIPRREEHRAAVHDQGGDRKSGGEGKSGDLGGRRIIKKKKRESK